MNKSDRYDHSAKISDVHWRKTHWDENTLYAITVKGEGRITVLDRMTGFSFGRDIETAYRDNTGKFWLASGNYDVRQHPEFTIAEAIEWIKAHANTCIGE